MGHELVPQGSVSDALRNKAESPRASLDPSLLPKESAINAAIDVYKLKKPEPEETSEIIEIPTKEQALKRLRHWVALIRHQDPQVSYPKGEVPPSKEDVLQVHSFSEKSFFQRVGDRAFNLFSNKFARTATATAVGVTGATVAPVAIVQEGQLPSLEDLGITLEAPKAEAASEAVQPESSISNTEIKPQALEGDFASPLFQDLWQKDDKPVEDGVPGKTWTWGPAQSSVAYSEPYKEAPGGIRLVQYFEKTRMEINYKEGTSWPVTNGLLAKELATGQMQTGDDSFQKRQPSEVNIAGDENDSRGPTYRTFGDLMYRRLPRNAGQNIIETVTREGVVLENKALERYNVKFENYIPETDRYIPNVFVKDYDVFKWGFAITDPYWTKVNVGGVEQDVLVQLFERRVVTYTPNNPQGWKVEMGNVGRHYHQWRYGKTIEDAAKEGVGGRLERYEGNGWEINISEKSLLALRPTDIQKLNKIPSVIPGKPKMRLYLISQEEALAGFMGIPHSEYVTYDTTDPSTNKPVHMGRMYLDYDEDGKLEHTGLAIIYWYSSDPINQIGMQWTKVDVLSIMQGATFDQLENIDLSNQVAALLHEGTKLEWN